MPNQPPQPKPKLKKRVLKAMYKEGTALWSNKAEKEAYFERFPGLEQWIMTDGEVSEEEA